MKSLKILSVALSIIYLILTILFLMDIYTALEMKSQFLKSAVYFGVFLGIPILLFLNYVSTEGKAIRVIGSIAPILMAVYLTANNPLSFIFNAATWKTDTIEYVSSTTTNRKIEYQIKDIGAFGYNKRVVELYYITPLFMVVNIPPQDYKNSPEWIEVNKNVNEAELKFP